MSLFYLGKAAIAIGGTTVHSAFRISKMKTSFTNLSASELHSQRIIFEGVKAIIIDEISMLPGNVFTQVNDFLQYIFAVSEPFAGLDIYLCGDLRQLPAVKATPCYAPIIQGSINTLWHNLCYFPLIEVVRQSDGQFSSILTKIGNGEELSEEEIQVLQARHRTIDWCAEHKPDVVRLFFGNREVDEYNINSYKDGKPCKSTDILLGCSSTKEEPKYWKLLKNKTVTELGGLPYLIRLVIGLPYVITSNIDVQDGLVNGAVGTLQFIEVIEYGSNYIILNRKFMTEHSSSF